MRVRLQAAISKKVALIVVRKMKSGELLTTMKLGSMVAGVLFVALNLCFVKQLSAAQASSPLEGTKAQMAKPSSDGAAAKSTSANGHKPATYVGGAVCKACHSGLAKEFSKTMMGKIFIAHPRDEVERQSCEGCHGPGSLYVKDMTAAMGKGHKPDEVGTGPAGGGLITFRKGAEPEEAQNQVCLNCHERGERAFWRASTHAFRGVRCVDCHTVMRGATLTEQQNPQIRKSPLSTEFVNQFTVTRPETQVCTFFQFFPPSAVTWIRPSSVPAQIKFTSFGEGASE